MNTNNISVDFWNQCQKVFKSRLLDIILSTSGANARKCSNRASWTSFCRLLEPMLESAQIESPGCHFADFWGEGQKVLKSSFLDVILSTSGAHARSAQIESPGRYFADFWGQGQKVLKSSFLHVISSTSGAKARKCSNRASWASFCRLLEPRPIILGESKQNP